MKSRKPLYFSISLLLLFFIHQPLLAQRKYDYKKTINQDSLEQVIGVSEGKEKLASIILYCRKFLSANPQKCQELTIEGMQLAERLADTHTKLFLAERSALAHIKTGDLAASLSTIKEALVLAELEKDTIALEELLVTSGKYFYTTGAYDSSLIRYRTAVQLAKSAKDPQGLVMAKEGIANIHLLLGEQTQAIELYDSSLEICQENEFNCTGILLNKASALNYSGKLVEALALFFQVRKAFYAGNRLHGAFLTDHHIGFLLKKVELYNEALNYLYPVETFFQETGDVYYLSHIKMTLGAIMLKLGRFEEAEDYLSESLKLKEEKGMQNLSDHFAYLGEVALARDSINKAIRLFNKGLTASIKLDNQPDIATIYNCLSTAHLRRGDYEQSVQYSQKALTIQSNSRILDDVFLTYENLLNAYLNLGKSRLAIEAKAKRDSIKAKMTRPDELMKITRKLVLETLKENEGNQGDFSAEIKKNNANSGNYWLSGIFVIGLCLFLLLYFISKRRTRIKDHVLEKKENLKKEFIPTEETQELLLQLVQTIKEHKPYLNASLTLRELAEMIPTTDKKLSALLNQALGTNFYDYLNKLRVEAFQEKWISGEYKNYSIVGLAELCGFSSKSSFYRAFKKETGISPSEFMKNAS